MTNSSEIFEKARELGQLIKDSDFKKKADETSKELEANEEAKKLIEGYNKLREEKMNELSGKQPTEEETEKLNKLFQEEFEKIAQNEVIKNYLDAARNYELMLSQMDSILKYFIVGEEHDHNCTGSCSSCGGCH